jgi:hypothetical protein
MQSSLYGRFSLGSRNDLFLTPYLVLFLEGKEIAKAVHERYVIRSYVKSLKLFREEAIPTFT